MAHAVAPDFRERDLYTTLFANDPAILHALIFTAQALVILDRAEDTRAEQTISFWFECAIIDCLRLLDLTKRPRVNPLGTGYRDADLIEALRAADLPKDIHQFIHSTIPFEKLLEPKLGRLHPAETPACVLAQVRCGEVLTPVPSHERLSVAALLQLNI